MTAVRADGVARAPTQWKIDGVLRACHDRPALRPDRHDLDGGAGDAYGPLVHVEHDVFWGTRTTSYHAPRRTLQFTSPRTRAHCGASGIVAPQELVALTHTRRWPGGAPSTAPALQARDTASRKGLPIGR